MKLLALFFVFFVYEALAAPTTYDQQQAGDLNVHVNLKDIQIVALLGEDILGDYDYSYDYSDFTIKPITPQATTSSSSSSTSVKPWHTWPTIPSTTSASTSAENPPSVEAAAEHLTTNSPHSAESEDAKPPAEEAAASSSPESAAPEEPQTIAITNASDEPKPQATPSTETIKKTETPEPADVPSNEKDLIASASLPAPLKLEAASSPSDDEKPVPSAAPEINSETSTGQSQNQPMRKCHVGYTRDQKGRCSPLHNRRRIPASLIPFGIRLTPRIHRHRDQQSDTSGN